MVGMLFLNWELALFAFALLPLFVLLTRRVGAERRRIAKTTQETLADISSLVQESLSVSGILLGKTMGRGGERADRLEAVSLRLAELEVRQRDVRHHLQALQLQARLALGRVDPRVLDRDGRPVGGELQKLDLVLGELPGGERADVKHADDSAVDEQRDPEQ